MRVLLARCRVLLLRPGCYPCLQEIRHVLGSAGGGGADGVPADDPVTSLDMCVASDCLLAGHGSGRILLWDYLRWGQGHSLTCAPTERADGERASYSVLYKPGHTRDEHLPHTPCRPFMRKHVRADQIRSRSDHFSDHSGRVDQL